MPLQELHKQVSRRVHAVRDQRLSRISESHEQSIRRRLTRGAQVPRWERLTALFASRDKGNPRDQDRSIWTRFRTPRKRCRDDCQSGRRRGGLERDQRESCDNRWPPAAGCRSGFCYRALGDLRRC